MKRRHLSVCTGGRAEVAPRGKQSVRPLVRYHAIMRRRAFVAGLLTTAATLGSPRDLFAYASPPARADYSILIDGRDSGRHSVAVVAEGPQRIAMMRSTVDVRFLAIPVYTYEHLSREIWRGDTLVGFESRTTDSGRYFQVAGRSTPSAFVVDVNGYRSALPLDVAPATYWDRTILGRPHVLDPEDGRLFRHQVGRERAAALDWVGAAAEVDVTSFTSGVVWYAPTGRFLGCRFRKDQHDIEFRALPG
jgi:hypothetical protein